MKNCESETKARMTAMLSRNKNKQKFRHVEHRHDGA